MKQVFISKEQTQFKANLHSHSTLSDGSLTPEQMKEIYKNHGYSILAITDHERPAGHSDLNDENFLLLTGYEAYIRHSKECIHDYYEKEIHLNLFAKTHDNLAYICYNDAYCKYIKDKKERDVLKKVGSQRTREYTPEYVNEFIKTATENGYLVSFNHPVWSMESEAFIIGCENIFSLEIDNYASWRDNRLEHDGALYDALLRSGKHWFCHAGDDNHNRSQNDVTADSFGAFTMILADKLDYTSVIAAMENGNMYASTGPEIHEISLEGNQVHIECSPAECIIVYDGSQKPYLLESPLGDLMQADFTLRDRAKYFRVSIIDIKGNRASSRGYFIK